MKVSALQYDIIWEDPATNFRRLIPWIDAAAGAGTRLLVLPEMFACGFSMNTQVIAEPVGGPTTEFLHDQARRTGMWIGGSLPERDDEATRPRNTFVVASPNGDLVRYHKIHPFSAAREDRHYEAGTAFQTVNIDGLRVTLFVCYDLRFADEFWQTGPSTDCFVVVANWPDRRRHHWQTLLRARAIENQAYVVGVNRVGEASGLDYAGDTAIIDCWGHVLAEASIAETLVMAEVSADEVARARETFPFLADRRTARPVVPPGR
ncbi:MAG: carbon-nitrogen family hydrolase [Myxococcales bacterium FL481]|nr:MAG: carbon-nitrogen family hydrolase [Myxococcales bacterium FL481]